MKQPLVFNFYSENRHVCHPNPCQNGGTCRKVAANRLECSCLMQFHGKYCERKLKRCLDYDDNGDNDDDYNGSGSANRGLLK